MFDINDRVVKIWTVSEANEFINNDKIRKIQFQGKEHTFFSDKEVFKYSVLLDSGAVDIIFVEDIVTVDSSKLM